MFAIALIIGIYAYGVFALGLTGLLFKQYILMLTTLVILFSIKYFWKNIQFINFFKIISRFYNSLKGQNALTIKILIIIFILLLVVNLLGALGPELSFDALWYHLTLPKIYLEKHTIFHIPGGLLYYSDMPKLTEMLYIPSLMFGNEITAKLVHFLFGLLTSFAIYKFCRKYYSVKISLVGMIVFYSNIVVGWESTTAYIDLARTFFEFMALWGFVNFLESKKRIWLIESSLIMGLAISTKLLSITSLIIYILIIIFFSKGYFGNYLNKIKSILFYISLSILVSLPWFIFSYLNTKNPFYPFLSQMYPVKLSIFSFHYINPINFIKEVWMLFVRSEDPVSPIYLIVLPVLICVWNKYNKYTKIIAFYCILSLFLWYLVPRTGGGRFIMSYLPAFSVLVASTIREVNKSKIKSLLIFIIVFLSLTTISYRFLANIKFIPYIIGIETKKEFLNKNLNFSYGGFYDTDDYLKHKIKNNDMVLIYGIHNLFYADFPYIHESWVQKGDEFNYLLLQNADIPERFKYWKLIYENNLSNVKLYSFGGQKWVY